MPPIKRLMVAGLLVALGCLHCSVVFRVIAFVVIILKVCATCSSDEFHQVSEPWTAMIVFSYVMAVMMYFRSGWYCLCRKTCITPALVPVVALLLFGFLQTIPGLVKLSHGDSCGFVPFCLSGGEWTEVYSSHLVASADALALGLLAMLPEAMAAFRSRPMASGRRVEDVGVGGGVV